MLLLAHAAQNIRSSNVEHPEIMTALHGWPDPASSQIAGYAVAHASMARTLSRLERRGLLVRSQSVPASIRLTLEGVEAARRILAGLGTAKRAHCIHVAGHLIVALALGMRVGVAHIVPRFKGKGGGIDAFSTQGGRRAAARNRITVAWGGVCAEGVAIGGDARGRIKNRGAAVDFKHIERIARRFRISEGAVERLKGVAMKIVFDRVATLNALAVALRNYGILGGKDALAVYSVIERLA